MKNLFPAMVCAFTMAFAHTAAADEVVSNLGEPAIGDGWAVTPNAWTAMSFTVGTDFPTWSLDSLDLRLWCDGLHGGFSVNLLADNGGQPGTSITTFTGPDPLDGTPTNYTYLPDSAVSLTAGGTYWISLTSVVGGYSWVYTDSLGGTDTGTNGWSIGDTPMFSADTGGTWASFSSSEPSMMAVHATPVPEPATLLSVGLLGLGLVAIRRRRETRSVV